MHKTIAGATVLELGGYIAAPFGSLLLAGLGARVIKVESLRGDETRHLRDEKMFIASNVGKESIALDLKSGSGADVFGRLMRNADVVLHNLSVEATRDLHLTYEDCRRTNPEIIYCHIAGFGNGPYADRLATNPLIEALVGTMVTLAPGGKPIRMGGSYYDQMAGALAALAVVAALGGQTEETGRHIRIGLFETGLYLDASRLRVRKPGARNDPSGVWNIPGYDAFKSADDRWVFVGAVSDSLWRKLCQALSLADVLADPSLATPQQRWARRNEVTAIIAEALATKPSEEIITRLNQAGVPCVPVNEFDDVMRDEHLQADGKLAAATFNGRRLDLPTFPVAGGAAQRAQGTAAPQLGEQSIPILRALGYDDTACGDLVSRRVVSTP